MKMLCQPTQKREEPRGNIPVGPPFPPPRGKTWLIPRAVWRRPSRGLPPSSSRGIGAPGGWGGGGRRSSRRGNGRVVAPSESAGIIKRFCPGEICGARSNSSGSFQYKVPAFPRRKKILLLSSGKYRNFSGKFLNFFEMFSTLDSKPESGGGGRWERAGRGRENPFLGPALPS